MNLEYVASGWGRQSARSLMQLPRGELIHILEDLTLREACVTFDEWRRNKMIGTATLLWSARKPSGYARG